MTSVSPDRPDDVSDGNVGTEHDEVRPPNGPGPAGDDADTAPGGREEPTPAGPPRGRAEVRRAVVETALRLFTERGYEETTVDDIAAAAGVARRTFFRYFSGKEDAVSPDHEAGLARVGAVFAEAHPDEPLLSVTLRAGETVFDLYLPEPEAARTRFALVGKVPALRDREVAMVHHYRRLFTRELTARLAGTPDGALRAAVAGAGVVAAHNQALRRWLGDGGSAADCVAHFRKVADLLPLAPGRGLEAVVERLEHVAASLEKQAR